MGISISEREFMDAHDGLSPEAEGFGDKSRQWTFRFHLEDGTDPARTFEGLYADCLHQATSLARAHGAYEVTVLPEAPSTWHRMWNNQAFLASLKEFFGDGRVFGLAQAYEIYNRYHRRLDRSSDPYWAKVNVRSHVAAYIGYGTLVRVARGKYRFPASPSQTSRPDPGPVQQEGE